MSPIEWRRTVQQEADALMSDFTKRLREKLATLSPGDILRRKNPFLFRVRAGSDVRRFSNMLVTAYLSSSEETMFGDVLEKLAVSVCKHAKDGRKSSTEGIDLEYEDGGLRTICQVKSGPNWGNSDQKKRMIANFVSVRKRMPEEVRCIEGVCYGPAQRKNLGTHWRLVGESFWHEISDTEDMMQIVLEALGRRADNSLRELRGEAAARIVSHLAEAGAVVGDKLHWDRALRVMSGGALSSVSPPGHNPA